MASASSEPVGRVGAESERIAALEAELERSERRRAAAEEWATFLERELEERDQRLEAVIEQYETQLAGARRREASDTDAGGPLARLVEWLPSF
jgi:hypothetical protein